MLFGEQNPVELFTEHLLSAAGSWSEYASLCSWLLLPYADIDMGVNVIQDSGVLSFWVLQGLRIAEGTTDMQVTIDDRI